MLLNKVSAAIFKMSVEWGKKQNKKLKEENLTSLWSKKLHYKFIESTEDGDFMLALDAVGQLRRIASRKAYT